MNTVTEKVMDIDIDFGTQKPYYWQKLSQEEKEIVVLSTCALQEYYENYSPEARLLAAIFGDPAKGNDLERRDVVSAIVRMGYRKHYVQKVTKAAFPVASFAWKYIVKGCEPLTCMWQKYTAAHRQENLKEPTPLEYAVFEYCKAKWQALKSPKERLQQKISQLEETLKKERSYLVIQEVTQAFEACTYNRKESTRIIVSTSGYHYNKELPVVEPRVVFESGKKWMQLRVYVRPDWFETCGDNPIDEEGRLRLGKDEVLVQNHKWKMSLGS